MDDPSAVLIVGFLSATAIVLAARWSPVVAAKEAHRNKVAEFRQAWINAFREEMAEFLTASERHWTLVHAMPPPLEGQEPNHEREVRIARDQILLAYNRMHLRINPNPNENRASDVRFLQTLEALLDLASSSTASQQEWEGRQSRVRKEGSELLKREWERVKAGNV